MESRIEKLIAFEKEIMPERLESTLESLEREYQLHGERADANFLKTAENMFLETARLQKPENKNAEGIARISANGSFGRLLRFVW